MPDSSPTNPQSTSTSDESPSARNASPKAAGMLPPRNWPAVATQSRNVTANPPIITASRSPRRAPRPPMAAVTRGTARVQTSRCTLSLQFGKPADVHRFESAHDAADENSEHEDRQDHVERNAEFDDERHPRSHADGYQEDRVFDREQREDLRDGLL